MDALRVLLEASTFNEVLRGVAISVLLAKLIPTPSNLKAQDSTFITASGFLLIYFFARCWLALVNHYAPEPYLDEVFHIPQAQVYCQGRYQEWDDKITTPPGLYLLSVGWHKLMRLAECTPSSLRSNNLVATLLTALLALSCRRRIEAQTATATATGKEEKEGSAVSLYAYHTAINIALFPVIYFFSGLYYTDVASTLVVLVAYRNHLDRVVSPARKPGFLNGLWTVVLGVAALFMRQTNVFWVVVYMGGLEVAHVVKGLKPKPVSEKDTPSVYTATVGEFVGFWLKRYAVGDVHDPPVDMAWPDDWALSLLSIGIAAICNPLRVLRQVWPHITTMGLFAGFVAWNGGVVLGDKSNHIATIHLPQMLYIWPFFAFFSAPLLVSPVLSTITGLIPRAKNPASSDSTPGNEGLSSFRSTQSSKSSATKANEVTTAASSLTANSERNGSALLKTLEFLISHKVYYPVYILFTILLSAAIVKYNTIIHPFTLADNRHYMFYIFRYTILRSSSIRLVLVFAYTLSRWLVWKRLEGDNPPSRDFVNEGRLKNAENKMRWRDEFSASPFASHPSDMYLARQRFVNRSINEAPENKSTEKTNARNAKQDQGSQEEDFLIGSFTTLSLSSSQPSPSTSSPRTSTVLLWLLTTTLSLITAPLVEPRYFILPWVFYRLLVPAMPVPCSLINGSDGDNGTAAPAAQQQQEVQKRQNGDTRNRNGSEEKGFLWNLVRRTDLTLTLETVWFLAINVVTMYMFLFKPFNWKNAATGEILDGGRVQRFMW
ncbi:DIE2/ALG10 family-domain-containing protein [Sordaria brevicollis]|uniref:Dol-P-Glc:Glc(2)Man(9)GlcNAc(2)-PP-Dol alpha-1,2-glucosyltransferase n=1 Tax=Sordaria brevicollis TaxID=83679 RepID=A0AAE0PE93_SORBR|nr:DIE2/ALG10 family-domain-containing protein [Sordaria brevicollis]